MLVTVDDKHAKASDLPLLADGVTFAASNIHNLSLDGQDGGNLRLRARHFQVPQGISADLIATLDLPTRQVEIEAPGSPLAD